MGATSFQRLRREKALAKPIEQTKVEKVKAKETKVEETKVEKVTKPVTNPRKQTKKNIVDDLDLDLPSFE